MLHFVLLLASAIGSGLLFDLLHVPVAWLLGPMVTGMAAAAIHGRPRPLHSGFMSSGQVIIGLGTGAGFSLATLIAAADHALPLLLTVVITIGLSLLNGYLLWRWAGVGRATGFMGSLPGAAHSMVAMADEVGADAVAVAVLQYVRLLLVLFLAPLAVHTLFPAGSGAPAAGEAVQAGLPPAALAVNVAVLTVCGLAGSFGGRWVRLPSPTFLGPFLAVMAAAWTLPWAFHVPGLAFKAALLLVGLSIGVRFDVPAIYKLGRVVLIESGLVVALIGICLGVGYAFHLLTGVDTLTAVLGSTPGGADVMVASAAELGANVGLVVAMQMSRLLLVLLTGPWAAGRLVQKTREPLPEDPPAA